jgi:hypothetical protein
MEFGQSPMGAFYRLWARLSQGFPAVGDEVTGTCGTLTPKRRRQHHFSSISPTRVAQCCPGLGVRHLMTKIPAFLA